jgi:GntR family transcriptional regulator
MNKSKGKMKKYSIDHNSVVPLHSQVEALIREMVNDPNYKNGNMLPSEIDLAKQLGISRNTVRQATNKLVLEGLLIRKKGIGTWFADRTVQSRVQNWLSFSQEMEALGIKIINFEINVDWVIPDRQIAEFFNIPLDKEILKMERLRGSEDGPFVYFISYFNPRIGLTGKEDFTRPLYEILERDYSTVVKISREQISARKADKCLAEKLKLNVNDPILKRKRLVYDPGYRPVEYNLGYYRADSFVYKVESERE